jgi:hypothetical protein
LDKTVIPDIKNMVSKVLNDTLNSRGYKRNANSYSI